MLNLDQAWAGTRPPRDWQRHALPIVSESLNAGEEGPLVHAVMGAGKSVLIAEMTACALAGGAKRVVITTPTQMLVEQLAETVAQRVGRANVGRFYGRVKESGQPVTVTCYPSVSAMVGQAGLGCDLWICDEAHRSESPRELASFDELNPARRVAVTATPFRGESGRLSLWTRQIVSYGMGQAITDNVLTPFRVVPWTGGRDVIDNVCIAMLHEHAPQGPGVIDATSIADAESFADRLAVEGYRAAVVHSRQRTGERDRVLADLQAGRIDIVVHVAMLVEGVDLPWLRWLMQRRPTSSKVRFLQQLGRVLRASAGKTEAVIFDPLDLFSKFQLNYAAVLADDIEEESDEPSEEKDKDERDYEREIFGEPEYVEAADARRQITVWARHVWHAANASQIVEDKSAEFGGKSASWRYREATERQAGTFGKMLWTAKRSRDLQFRDSLSWLAANSDRLTRGSVSDLLDVMFGLARSSAWVPPIPIPPIPRAVREAVERAP